MLRLSRARRQWTNVKEEDEVNKTAEDAGRSFEGDSPKVWGRKPGDGVA